MEKNIVDNTIAFVKETLAGAEGGHDWSHTERVWKTARYIREEEGAGDQMTIELAALLHDIADPKFNGGDELQSSRLAYEFLIEQGLDHERANHIRIIIEHVSFKGGMPQDRIRTIEFRIVQDADRLDALGAIGIARAFNYGGFKNRSIYDPAIPPTEYSSTEAYRKSTAPTINHFHEKLLRLKELMNTPTGKQMAEERHAYMVEFLNRFYSEWDPGTSPGNVQDRS